MVILWGGLFLMSEVKGYLGYKKPGAPTSVGPRFLKLRKRGQKPVGPRFLKLRKRTKAVGPRTVGSCTAGSCTVGSYEVVDRVFE